MVTASMKNLHINAGELPEGSVELSLECDAETLGLKGLPILLKGNVLSELRLEKSGERIDVRGVVTFAYEVECSRCLNVFPVSGSERVLLHCTKAGFESGGGEVQLKEEDVITYPYKENTIDLTDAIRDAVLLSVPIKPLCSTECKGLCPVCGQDLNHTRCSCSVHIEDERWDALKRLKSNTGED